MNKILKEIDKKILSLLDSDCRLPINDTAEIIGLSRQTVTKQLENINNSEYIYGKLVVFDSGVLGYNWYRLLIRLLNITKDQKRELIDYLRENNKVAWLGEVGGRWDIVVNFACKSPADFRDISESLAIKYGQYIKETEVLIYVNIHDYSRIYLNQSVVRRREFFHKMEKNDNFFLDDLDKKILTFIGSKADYNYLEIAEICKVSRNTIKNRIKKFEENKLILGNRAFLNLEKTGFQSNMLFLEINSLNRERETELHLYLKVLPEVTFVVEHIGKWRLGIEVETSSADEFQKFLINLRSNFSDLISDYETFPLLKDHIINYLPQGVLDEL